MVINKEPATNEKTNKHDLQKQAKITLIEASVTSTTITLDQSSLKFHELIRMVQIERSGFTLKYADTNFSFSHTMCRCYFHTLDSVMFGV